MPVETEIIVPFILMLTALFIIGISYLWLLINAFREHILWGLGILFFPIVLLVFLILHWKRAYKPFLLSLFGICFLIISFFTVYDTEFMNSFSNEYKEAQLDTVSTYTIPDINLQTADDPPVTYSLTLFLYYEPDTQLNDEIVQRNDQISRLAAIVLRGKNLNEINTKEQQKLRSEELKAHINQILVSGTLTDVAIDNLIVSPE